MKTQTLNSSTTGDHFVVFAKHFFSVFGIFIKNFPFLLQFSLKLVAINFYLVLIIYWKILLGAQFIVCEKAVIAFLMKKKLINFGFCRFLITCGAFICHHLLMTIIYSILLGGCWGRFWIENFRCCEVPANYKCNNIYLQWNLETKQNKLIGERGKMNTNGHLNTIQRQTPLQWNRNATDLCIKLQH